MPSLPNTNNSTNTTTLPKYSQNLQRLLSSPISTQSTSLKYLKPILLVLESSDEFCYMNSSTSPPSASSMHQRTGSNGAMSSSHAKNAAMLITRASSAHNLINGSVQSTAQYKKKRKQAMKQLLDLWEFLLQRMSMENRFDEDAHAENASHRTNKKEPQKVQKMGINPFNGTSKTASGAGASQQAIIPPSTTEQQLILQILLCLMKRKEFLSEMEWDETLQRLRVMEQEQRTKRSDCPEHTGDSDTPETDSEDASLTSTTTAPLLEHTAKRKNSTTPSEKENKCATTPVPTKSNPRKDALTNPTTPASPISTATASSGSPFSNLSSFIRTQIMGKSSPSAHSSSSLSLLKKRSKKQSIISIYANRLNDTLLLALYFLSNHSSHAPTLNTEKPSSFLIPPQKPMLTPEQERFCACVLGLSCLQILPKDICTMVIDAICVVTLRKKPSSHHHRHKSKSRRHQKTRHDENTRTRASSPPESSVVAEAKGQKEELRPSDSAACEPETPTQQHPTPPSELMDIASTSAAKTEKTLEVEVPARSEVANTTCDLTIECQNEDTTPPATFPTSYSSDTLTALTEKSSESTCTSSDLLSKSKSLDHLTNGRKLRSSSYFVRQSTHTQETEEKIISTALIPHYFTESYHKSAVQPITSRAHRSSSTTARLNGHSKSRTQISERSELTSALHPIRKASLSRDVKELVASNLPAFQKNLAYDLILPQVSLNPPQLLHLKDIMKNRYDFIPSSNNFFFHFLGQFSELISTLKLEYRHIRRYLNLIRVYAALILEEGNQTSRGPNDLDWASLSMLLLQNKDMVNLLLDIELCRTNAYSVDAVFRTLDRTEKWIRRVGKLSSLRSDLLVRAVNAGFMTDHFRISSKMLVFLYNTFDELYPSVRQNVVENLLKQWGLLLLCHWHDDVRVCFARLLIYKLLWKPALPSLQGNSGNAQSNSTSPMEDDEDRVSVSLKSKAETYLYIIKLYDKIMHSPSTSSKQQLEEKLPPDMRLTPMQKGYVFKTMKDINDIQKEYQKWKQGVFVPYRKRWVEKLKAAAASDSPRSQSLTPAPIPYPIIRIPKFSLRDI